MALFKSKDVATLGMERDVKGLLKVLASNKNPSEQATAARSLGQLGDASAIDPLRQALGSEHEDVADQALRALARIEGPEAAASRLGFSSRVGMISKGLREDEDPEMRKLMARALGSETGNLGLLAAWSLVDGLKIETDDGVVQDLLAALIRIGDRNVIPRLFEEVIADKKRPQWLRDQTRRAIDAIGG